MSEGLQVPLLYVNEISNFLFMRLTLFVVFMGIMMASYFSQKRRNGEGDIVVSFAVAGFITTGFAIILSIIPGLIDIKTLVTTIAVAVVGIIMLFFSGKD